MTDTAEQTQLARAKTDDQVAMAGAGVRLSNIADLARFAKWVSHSGLAPKGLQTESQIFVAVQHGLEVGLKPMQAIQSIAVINGRPCLWGDAALALVKAHPKFESIHEHVDGDGDQMVAVCKIKRKGEPECSRSFSVADAKTAGLWQKQGPWTQYPKRMLQMRARGFAMRDSSPDALKGISVAEEVVDYIDVDATPVETSPAPPSQSKADALAESLTSVPEPEQEAVPEEPPPAPKPKKTNPKPAPARSTEGSIIPESYEPSDNGPDGEALFECPGCSSGNLYSTLQLEEHLGRLHGGKWPS